jgi:hypothetical protein
MTGLAIAAALVVLLFISTTAWALQHLRASPQVPQAGEIVRARIWAAGVSFAQLLVLIIASTMALFVAGETGPLRLLAAVASPVVEMGLGLCGIVALYPAYLCGRAWRSKSGRFKERVHLTLHLAGIYALVFVLLAGNHTG